jgi:putative ABC transport system permease protein
MSLWKQTLGAFCHRQFAPDDQMRSRIKFLHMMSISIALRNLLQDRFRLILSIAGVASAVMLVLILEGFVAGLYLQVGAYLENAPGSIVVNQQGVTNLLGATSILPPDAEGEVRRIDGVEDAVPLLSQFVILDLHELKQPAYLIGYPSGDSPPVQRGGPWQLSEGRELEADDEMIFDRVLAERHSLQVGDRFELMGTGFWIVGLSEGTTSWMTSFVFIRKSAAEVLFGAPDATSLLLVTTSTSAHENSLQESLASIEGIDALPKSEVIQNDTKLLVEVFSAPIRLMAGIAFLVGVLVVGLVIYTATVERYREYGVLKAIGSGNGLLYRLVGVQAAVASSLGSIGGLALAAAAAELIMLSRPEFLIILRPSSIAIAFVSGVGMAVLAGLIPARSVARLEPAAAFRRAS